MIHDAQSNPLAGATPRARDLFDAGCEAFATYSGDPVSLFDAAAAEAPDCLMIHLARAWCFTGSRPSSWCKFPDGLRA